MWTRPFLLLNLSYFLVFANIAFFYLYPLALDRMGCDRETIGWVMGIFSLATVLTRPLMGKVAASRGEPWLISRGMIVLFLASLSYAFVTGFGPGMLLVRVVHGIGFSAFITGSFSWVAKTYEAARGAQAYGMVGASLMGGVASAPPLGEILIAHFGFHALYLAAAGCAAAAILGFLCTGEFDRTPASSFALKAPSYLRLLKNRTFLFLLLSTLIFAHGQSTTVNFLALLAAGQDASGGRFFFVSFLTAIVILLGLGRTMDRYGKVRFLRWGYPFLCMALLMIPAVIGSWLVFGAALIYGAATGLLFPCHNALAAAHGKAEEKPAFMSLFTAVYDGGYITGAVASGWLAQRTGLDALFVITGLLGCLGVLVVFLSPLEEK
jgi:predicted MFS family arabinose efflux permease